MPPHFVTNFGIQKYYQNEPKFNGAYSRNNLRKIKDVAYVINFDKYESIVTHWITEEHLTIQYVLIVLEFNIFQTKFKIL